LTAFSELKFNIFFSEHDATFKKFTTYALITGGSAKTELSRRGDA